jgi:putative ABC transport system substrate-binding protein
MGGRALRSATRSRDRTGAEASRSNCHRGWRPASVCSESGVNYHPDRVHGRSRSGQVRLGDEPEQARGNATGVNLLLTETESKRVDLLRELAPAASVFAAVINPKNADAEMQSTAVRSAAHNLGWRIEVINASNENDLENAFNHFAADKIGGFILTADPFFVYRREQIISAAAKHQVPAVYFLREFAESGGLASYGIRLADAYWQAGTYVGKILGGTKPADLPVVQPTKFELVINLKTAKALGLTIPPSLLAIADEVIE